MVHKRAGARGVYHQENYLESSFVTSLMDSSI
jgi:hypothetical protein